VVTKEKDVTSKEKSLEISKISYEELMEWPTTENISKANNSIRQAQIKLDNANKNLDDYVLTAPFDWIVRTVDYMVWDNLKNDTNKYIYIENPDLIEITVKLDQVDVVNVEVWDDAEITFDAYTKNPAKAKVSLIDTTPVSTSWVISYEVKLVLDDEDFDKRILSWMTANVEIIIDQRENVLILKTQAIKEREWKSYVTLEENWTRREVEIETWFSANWDTEILSWLNEWDRIVSQTFAITSETSTTTNTFQMWWGMWGGMPGWTMRMWPWG
jgi:multidrug efflux pump subunit AcrA (membrane-fusion protein)